MTLILSYVAPDFAVQCSDRRVSLPGGSHVEDRANKAIFFCHHTAWAYTGIAQVGMKRTDEWLFNQFMGKTTAGEATQAIAKELTRALRMMATPTGADPRILKRIAIIGVGFAQFSAEGPEPVLSIVSNFYDESEGWKQFANIRVTPHVRRTGDQPFIFSAGQTMAPKRLVALERGIRTALRRKVGPHAIARLLTEEVQEHGRYNRSIGRNVISTLITRRGVGRSKYIGTGMTVGPEARPYDSFRVPADWNGEPRYIYAPADETATVHYSPAVVCPGMAVSGMALGPKPDVDAITDLGPFPPYELIAL